MSILKFLGLARGDGAGVGGGAGSAPETVRRIVDALDRMDPERARYIASFANVLSRVAHADLEISKAEIQVMERIVREIGGLPEEEAILVVQMAKSHTVLFGSTESYLVTREFYKMATPEEKLHLLDCLFAVSSANESISSEEEAEIRRIVAEMNLTHADFIRARSKYSHHVDVLKRAKESESP
jgi:uncharacterized tellurite resistance protein B-like protein